MHPVSLLRTSVMSSIWSVNRETTLTRLTSSVNFSTQTDSSTPKSESTQQRFHVISNKDLHPDLKLPAEHIVIQHMFRLGGALFYPLLSACGVPHVLTYTPVCVGTHHISIRFAYRAALETLKAGDIAANSELNDEIKSKIASKRISRFHINDDGDLVLHMGNPEQFSLSKLKGIKLVEDLHNNPLLCKVNAIKDKIFPSLASQISYFHLEDDVRKQAENILVARQFRFRACMGTALTALMFGTCHSLMDENISEYISSPLLSLFCLLGIGVQGSNLQSFRVAKHTNDLWNLIRHKNEFMDIIKPKYRGLYRQCDFNKDMYLNVSTFGNIQYSDQKLLSIRKKYLLKHDNRDTNES